MTLDGMERGTRTVERNQNEAMFMGEDVRWKKDFSLRLSQGVPLPPSSMRPRRKTEKTSVDPAGQMT